MRRNHLFAATFAVLTASVVCGQTVTLMLESPASGKTVVAGKPVDWTIKVQVSQGDNVGLALVSCDLAQEATNPAHFDLTPGKLGSLDSTMYNFSRPAGISNPGEGTATGYLGVRRSPQGQTYKNLIQIGGGQNTFGQALAPGAGVGENANVVAGVGQGGAAQVVLSGSFIAPSTPGQYTFRLQNGIANVLTQRNDPPAHSPVTPATADLSGAHFTVTVVAAQTAPPGQKKQPEDVQPIPPRP
jgi:hypothetical protein